MLRFSVPRKHQLTVEKVALWFLDLFNFFRAMAHLLRGLALFALATSSLANPIAGYATTYEVLTEGAGVAVSKGSQVTVHATGIVEESGYQFWSTKDAGQQPFSYQAGVGKVITGWDQGCLGMKIGEVRKLRIPAHEGYGANGFPAWKIPKQATLLFEIEVLKIDGKSKVEL